MKTINGFKMLSASQKEKYKQNHTCAHHCHTAEK